MNYKIEGKGKNGDWSTDYVDGGSVAVFATEVEAKAAIVDLVMTLGWSVTDLRVVKVLDHFKVYACAVTGEWLGEPEATGQSFTEREWFAKEDTDEEQFDIYDAELFEDDENGMPVPYLETRALTRRWVFSEEQQRNGHSG